MAVNAEFEEKEYEMPLYAGLSVINNHLWAPGQVLENQVGFDAAFEVTNFPIGGKIIGPTPPGTSLAANPGLFAGSGPAPPGSALPNFALNLFIQAKRPRFLPEGLPKVRKAGLAKPHWAFTIDAPQQAVLANFESALGSMGIVTYAAPAFHTKTDLFLRLQSGTVAVQSNYPAPSQITGHANYYYNSPGVSGIAASELQRVNGEALAARIQKLTEAETTVAETEWASNLARLAAATRQAIDAERNNDNLYSARYDNAMLQIKAHHQELYDQGEWAMDFQHVAAFLQAYRVQWACIHTATIRDPS